MTDETKERLEVAREILLEYHTPEYLQGKCFNPERILRILSRRDELMKKRGAVEALRGLKCECVHSDPYSPCAETGAGVRVQAHNKADKIEREIKEMEAKP